MFDTVLVGYEGWSHAQDALALAFALASDDSERALGSRGYGPIQRVLLGAVSTRVANAAAGPVLVASRTANGTS